MGIAVLFVTIVQVSNAILQAYGRPWIPVCNMLVGGIVKIAVNFILVSRPEININGAPVGTLLCYITVMSLNLYQIRKIAGLKYEFKDFILKPLVLGIVTGVVALALYNFIVTYVGNTIAVALSICVAGVCYLIVFILIKALNKNDMTMLPKGEKIIALLERFNLI